MKTSDLPRVVSLLPSSTEIVCALGMEAALVGRSHECDYPPSVTQLPILTAPKFNPVGTSAEVDQRVKTILQEATSVYRVDDALLKELAPDIVITQQQCEVCAVSFSEVERVVCDTLGDGAHLVSLEPNNLEDIFTDIGRVAQALGVPQRGGLLVEDIRNQMEQIALHAAQLSYRPTVATIEWIDPLMSGGNWMPTLVEMAGGINLFGQAGEHSPWLQWEELRAADPDIIVVLPCGYDIETTRTEMAALINRTDWADMRAVQQGQVYLTDGNQYFNRPGPRVLESLEILAEIFHPQQFHFGHESMGWVRL
jgi:iron complex transport system substrate-binding protein